MMDTESILMSWTAFGERIRKLREQRGLSREALASKCGLSAVYLKKLETGDRLKRTLGTLDRIARALDVELRVEFVRRQATRKAKG